MEFIEEFYSNSWRNLDSILLYEHPGFQFRSSVIITELDDCLIKKLSTNKLYDTKNITNIDIFAPEFIDKLKYESAEKSIIVVSNQISQRKINIDTIKKKVEGFAKQTKLEFLCLFVLKPNCFMKPHTGCWKFLNGYFKQHGTAYIHNALIVSNEGGIIFEIQKKKDDVIKQVVGTSDIDRAFAWNINQPFKTIDEYLSDIKPVPFAWDKKIIDPEIRNMYVQIIGQKQKQSENVFQQLGSFGIRNAYVIMIFGAPRCGKTKYANWIIKKWRSSTFGETNAIIRLGTDKYSERQRRRQLIKLTDDRISVILDGGCHNESCRKPYLDALRNKNIPILCIEVNCGIEMAKIFNHAHVEKKIDENIMLYKTQDYCIYKSTYERPKNSTNLHYIMHMPQIEESDQIMKWRY